MATEGGVGESFNCLLTMEGAIHAGHRVRITAPGLSISKLGVTGQELEFNFGVDDWGTPQNIGIIGDVEGRFILFCETTSPFYMSFNKLKVKKNQIQITIKEFEQGWQGAFHGLLFVTGVEAGAVSPDLQYKYKIPVGGSPKVITIKCNGAVGNALGVKMTGPTGNVYQETPSGGHSTGLIFNISDEGSYGFYVYSKGIWGTEVDGPLGSVTYDAYVDAVLESSGTSPQRGKILARDTFSTEPTLYTHFSDSFGAVVSEYESYLVFDMVPVAINPPPVSVNFSGSVTYSDGSGFNASGQWELRGYVYTISGTCLSSNAPGGAGAIGIQCFLNK